MKVYLIHHANMFSADEDPDRHLSPRGREEADRLGARLRAAGVAPTRILHSGKQWTMETAERLAAAMGAVGKAAVADYPVGTGDPVAPFIDEIGAGNGDLMMAGHADFLLRTASALVCSDETIRTVEFKPGNCTAFCLEETDGDWAVAYGWRQEHMTG